MSSATIDPRPSAYCAVSERCAGRKRRIVITPLRDPPGRRRLQWLTRAQTRRVRRPVQPGPGDPDRTGSPQDSPGIRQTYSARILPDTLKAVMSAEMLTNEPAGPGHFRDQPGSRPI
jgi:hypothetical protein